jgi:uracil phosphoribosyltransferase
MINPTLLLIPSAKIGYIVVKQEESTRIACQYYASIGSCDNSDVLVLDPMLATGESNVLAMKHIMQQNPSSVTMLCLIAAPEGIRKMKTEFPQVNIVTAAIDNNLNDKKFICQSLGDFVDRFDSTI